jgi:hypothetical protein
MHTTVHNSHRCVNPGSGSFTMRSGWTFASPGELTV